MIMKNNQKKLTMFFLAIVMFLFSTLSLFSSSSSVSANELDPASKILCKFEDGSEFVRFQSTDYFHYMFRSKSALTATQPIDTSWLNKLLGIAGYNFVETNEAILGRELRPKEVGEESVETSNESAPKVSAFDRFGMAGLRWSSYQGEWKYYHVNPCSVQGQVSPTTYGTFYEGRLEPKSTHNEVTTSIDPRSIQFNKGVLSSFFTAFSDTLSNALFTITKSIVTLTIVFVGLSFTDITEVLGMLDSDGESKGSVTGIFSSLFEGLFKGFTFIMIALTAVYIMYKGVFRREIRFAVNTLIKTILIFVVAIMMSINPSYWISMPNKMAAYGQTIMLNAMSPAYNEKTPKASLCDTKVASINDGVEFSIENEENMKTSFSKTNENMRSMIACNMWQTLLFEPWIRGQFGSEYKFEDLNAERVQNNNEDWVGTPSVPMGGGKSINNWALFQLSTQTNAHAQIGKTNMPVLINDINADWWRIVDAMSDYEEKKETQVDGDGQEQEFSNPVKKKTTDFWQSWIGNNRTERFGVALVSIFFGFVGSIAPLIFGLASAIFGLGITLLMMTSPVFLLIGLWGGRGEQILKGWVEALINTILKKISVSVLLVLSLFLSSTIMGMISEIGYIKAVILMIVTSIVLVKNRAAIMGIMANVNFGGTFDPRQKANQIFNFHKKAASEVTKVTAAAVGGGVAAHKTGQNAIKGAGLGASRQLSNRLYTTSVGRVAASQMDMTVGGEKITNHTCITCHKPLGIAGTGVETAYRDDKGNYYCTLCAEEMGLDKVNEVFVGTESEQSPLAKAMENPDEVISKEDIRSVKLNDIKSELSHRTFKFKTGLKKVGDDYVWNEEDVQNTILDNIEDVQRDFIVFKNIQMRIGRRLDIPPIPDPLHDYIDLSLINMAWQEARFEVIENTYKEAWKMWYHDNAQHISNNTEEEIQNFIDEINDFSFELEPEEVEHLVIQALQDGSVNIGDSVDKNIFIMRDGKLVKYNKDIDERNKKMSTNKEE